MRQIVTRCAKQQREQWWCSVCDARRGVRNPVQPSGHQPVVPAGWRPQELLSEVCSVEEKLSFFELSCVVWQ